MRRRRGFRSGQRVRGLLSAFVTGALGLAVVAVPAPAEAGTDRPDTLAAARKAAPTAVGPWAREVISSAKDQDWYKFVLAGTSYTVVTLGGLPADYALALVLPDGRELARSSVGGTGFEQIVRTLDPGTYFVRVWSARGAFSGSKPYALRLRAFGPGVQAISLRKLPVDVDLVGELLNSSPQWRIVQRVRVDFLSRTGKVLGGLDQGVERPRMARGEIVPFELSFSPDHQPRGTVGYRVTPYTTVASAVARPAFSVSVTDRTDRRSGGSGQRAPDRSAAPACAQLSRSFCR